MTSKTQNEQIKTIAFTGHREIDAASASALVPALKALLKILISHGATNFLAGGALGFDTIAALSVLELKKEYPHISLELILPCKTQTKRWSEENQAVYNFILENADKYEFVHENYTSYCMHDRNRRLVDGSDMCVAYLVDNGGGTAYTVSYAIKQGKEIINLAELI